MQAGPVQLQAGLTGGLFMIYLVKQNVFRNTEYKRSPQHKLQVTQDIQYTLHYNIEYYINYIDEV